MSSAPIWMYFVVFAKLAILAFAMLGCVPMLEKFVNKDEKKLSGITRVVHKGSTRYVELVEEPAAAHNNVAV